MKAPAGAQPHLIYLFRRIAPRAILLLCFSTLYALPARAQDSATEGKEFYVTFIRNNDTGDNVCRVRYAVTDTCYITARYGDGTYLDDHNNKLFPPGLHTITVDPAKCRSNSETTGSSNLMLRITATKNIGVHAKTTIHGSGATTTVLPETAWGTHYTVIGNNARPSAFITVIAPAGADITIRDAAGTQKYATTILPSSPVFTYAVFDLQSPEKLDLTGYTVESNQKVAVFSICHLATAVDNTTSTNQHNYEQLYPTNTAGKNFFLWEISSIDKVRILALEDATSVTWVGTTSPTVAGIGVTATTTKIINRHETVDFWFKADVYNNPPEPAWITSNKPVIVNLLLGVSPTVHWVTPIEQLVTRAMLAPFAPGTNNTNISEHRLDVMIPAGTELTAMETRDGQNTTPVPLTFHTNTSNPDYTVASLKYAESDTNVVITLSNPAGLIAYSSGRGEWNSNFESYLYTAGANAFDLTMFTITSKTKPYSDTYYSATREATHTFEAADNITVKRNIGQDFTKVSWIIHGNAYTGVTENTNPKNTLIFPASAFHCGKDSITMSVRYKDATEDSLYTGYIWKRLPVASDIDVSGTLTLCGSGSTTLTATSTTVASPGFKWYDSQEANANLLWEGAVYSPTLTATTTTVATTYCVSVLDNNDRLCGENKPGERKEVTVTVNPKPAINPVTPNSREYHLQDTVPAINFSCSPALSGVTYKWTNSNTHIGLAASGEGDIPAFEAKGIGRSAITVTPYYNNCAGTPTEFVITVFYMVPVNPHLRSNVVGQ
jgi:hypothetical protein